MKRLDRSLTDGLPTRPVFKALDAVLTAHSRPRLPAATHIRSILNSRLSNYERVGSLVRLMDAIIPGTARQLSQLLYDSSRLPIPPCPMDLLGFGTGATVFLLEREDGNKVLKIYRRSIGKGLDAMLHIADWFRRKYERALSWYGGDPLIPQSHFFVLHGPLLRRPAVAMLQPYVYGEKMDLFQDFTNDALLALIKTDHALRHQLRCFAEQTLRVYADQGRCVDFLGRDNLMLVRNGGRLQLVLIDYGMFDLARLKRDSPIAFSRIEECIRRLKSLCRDL